MQVAQFIRRSVSEREDVIRVTKPTTSDVAVDCVVVWVIVVATVVDDGRPTDAELHRLEWHNIS